MAKNSIRDYSATASSNTDVQSVNIDENCPASGINNAIREVMVDLKNVSTGAIALETPSADSLTVTGNAGIGNARTEGTLHVHTASAGTVTASTQADDLVVENSSEGGITIITPDDQSARIRFTSPSTNTDVGGASIFYRQNINKMNVGTSVSGGKLDLLSGAGVSAILADGDGNVTKPLQPSFLAQPSTAQNNVGITNGTSVTIALGTERYDVGGNFASNTFTAPVTGKYLLSATVYILNVDSAAVYIQFVLTTSNRSYFQLIDPDFGQDAVYWSFNHAQLCDMDANDTAYIQFAQYAGTIQADIQTETNFSGILIG